jgi:hypothetical protein
LRGAIFAPRKLAKTNVQTTLCDQGEPANASSLYLAVTPSPSLLAFDPSRRPEPPVQMTRDLRSRKCIASAGDVQTSCGRAAYEMSLAEQKTRQARRTFHLQSVNGPAKTI